MLCTEWWTLTNHDNYCISKFHQQINNGSMKKQLSHMMILEILSIAIINFYTGMPDEL